MSIPEDVLARLKDVEIVEFYHEFETDLRCLVTANHEYTIEGINQDEAEYMARPSDDEDSYPWENFYEDLRVTARNLAVVALITRLQYWIDVYTHRVGKPRSKRNKTLENNLGFLETELGKPPVRKDFFADLVSVRDSVIHANSRTAWKQSTLQGDVDRSVSPRYVSIANRVEVTEADLADAVQKAITQVKWFDDRLRTLGK